MYVACIWNWFPGKSSQTNITSYTIIWGGEKNVRWMNQTNTKSKSQIWGWDWICIQFGNYSHSLKSFRYSPMIGVWKYSGNEVWKHLVIWRVGYLDQSGVFGFDKSLHHRVNVQCGVKTPKWKWQTSTHLSSISNSDLNSFEFCKSVRLRSQESFGRQSPFVRQTATKC